MSAGATNNRLKVSHDLQQLAPLFRAAVEKALEECRNGGLDAFVYEAYRSPELQALYFSRGRTVKPPLEPVTNAATNLQSWHGYGLAVDVISRSKGWSPRAGWFEEVATIFKAHQCKWGGDWRSKDLPHFQWHLCRASPSEEARRIITAEGIVAVWQAVGAVGEGAAPVTAPTPQPIVTETGTVSAEILNLRADPSTLEPPVQRLARGTKVFIIEKQDGWLKVRVGGVDGFVASQFVTPLVTAGEADG